MPVRDLTDRPRIPRAGKIRLGEKEPNASGRGEHPVARPYFVVPDEVAAVLGEQPTELPIVFMSDDDELIASQWYRLYNQTFSRVCRGDGYRADALLDADVLKARNGDLTPDDRDLWAHGSTRGRAATQNVVRAEIECLGSGYDGKPACPMFERGTGCSVKAFLQFAIRGVPQLAVYQLDTGSVIGIANVDGMIHHIKSLTGGRIAGIPLLLKRIPVQTRDEHGKSQNQYSITLELDPIVTSGNLLSIAGGPVARYALPAPDESDAIDATIYDDSALVEGEVTAATTAPAAPQPPKPEYEPVAPIDLLNEISKRHGAEAAANARKPMTYLFGTMDLLKLDNDQRQEFARLLRVRLNDPEHTHELAYAPDGVRTVCRLCGAEMEPVGAQQGLGV